MLCFACFLEFSKVISRNIHGNILGIMYSLIFYDIIIVLFLIILWHDFDIIFY